MAQDQRSTMPVLVGWGGVITVAVVVALAVFAFFVLRDGFQVGDIVGGLVIGVVTFAVLAVVRRFSQR